MAGFQITEIVEVGPGWNKVRLSDGNVYTLDGNYNWRSNNPGNIEWGDFARSQGAIGPGAVPPGRDRAFAIFPTYEQGRQAKETLLFTTPGYLNSTKGGYPQGSIGAAISRYAPDFENNTGGYIKAITDALGVDANAKLTDLSPEQRVAMLNTMEQVEGYAVGDMFNEAGIRLPPAEVPNVVASALDTTPTLGKRNVLSTTPSGIDEAYRYTNTATGDLLPNQAIPEPAMSRGLLDMLKQGPEYQVLLPELPPSTLDRPNIPQSPIERTQLPGPEPKGLLDTLDTTVPQSVIERGTPRTAASPRGLLDSITGRNLGDEIAMSPIQGGRQTVPAMDDVQLAGDNLGWMMDSGLLRGEFDIGPVGQKPATRVVQSVPVSPQITMRDISPEREMELLYRGGGPTRPQPAAPRLDPVEQGAGGFGNLATLLGTNTPQQPSGVFQTTTPALAGSVLMPSNYRPQVNIPAMPTQDDPQSGADWSDFTGTFKPPEPKPDWIPLGDVMSPRPPAPAIAANPPPRPISPTPPRPAAPAAPTYRTVMQPTQVENPAYTAWKAANLGASNKPIPLGDVMHHQSRDYASGPLAAAGANFVATQMPAQWITVQKPVQVAVTPPRQIAPPPVIAPPVAAPMPMPIAAPPPAQAPGGLLGMLGNATPLGGLLGMLGGQTPMGGLLGSLFKPQERRAPIGAFLGTAANGGTLTQGYGGLLNSTSQNSDWWQDATGQSGNGDIGRGPAIGNVSAPHVTNAAHDARYRR